jgi:uncharacterized membrane protein
VSRKNRNRNIVHTQNTSLIAQAEVRQWSGPLPHPEALERYNQIVPGSAERIIKLAETQHDHRLEIEKSVIDSGIAAQKLGTILGFILAMTAILGGVFLIYVGKESTGITSIIAALAGLVGVFVYGKSEQKKELTTKAESVVKAR